MNRNQLLELLPKESTGAELGVCGGDYSEIILEIIQPKRLYLVDIWRYIDLGYHDKLMSNDKRQTARYRAVYKKFVHYDAVKIIRDYTHGLKSIIDPKSLDWIYIDADHSFNGCYDDLKLADELVHSDGVILGHDYDPRHQGTMDAVDQFVEENNYFLTLTTEEFNSSYLICRTEEQHNTYLNMTKV